MASRKEMAELTSIEHGSFDTAALQQELAQALEDDRLYKLTDNMKKRAIHTAANYDDFKNLVACADLKPISQKELRDFSRNERQTNLTYKLKPRREFGRGLAFEAPPADLHAAPATSVAFCRNWRRYLKTSSEKLRYLKLTTAPTLGEIFKSDLDADLFAEIVGVLVETWASNARCGDDDDLALQSEQRHFAADVLAALSETNRLALVLDFLDNNQHEKLQRLVALLSTPPVDATWEARCAGLTTTFRLGR
ncbi:hypothetical protein PybrP1_001670 [[Pythium] brassicae (nom. inval.)]|nr:hypothetical protein PybrP1_001670 [[Pythium] brassicae (nom. inval.)]